MTIDHELVRYLEALARIRLSEAERDAVEGDLQSIISYFDQLNALDTEGVEPLSHSFPAANVMREDVVRPSFSNEEILANAPEAQDGCFWVHRAVEG
ncbi:MAG: Asp-tRNA(Asn)/Glu-tRNA(Gln) amidotransferase subunit GatC [Oscillospiraceae bacterium]|jgi:aspartyl-tRNA(Asn)/glutamyl-tRNA(Gln) amidotransferase subunit C|nr:Asp-tRNA(Asn)/Glu-tRNA(Gln) amidotransferase subunit GatC [Oscillospiraceae bacterium]